MAKSQIVSANGQNLRIFENFTCDYTLPKFKEEFTPSEESVSKFPRGSRNRSEFRVTRSSFPPDVGDTSAEVSWQVDSLSKSIRNLSDVPIVVRIAMWVLGRLTSSEKRPGILSSAKSWLEWRFSERNSLSVVEFFSHVKHGVEELKIVEERARGYQEALSRASKSGQVALSEELERGLQAYRAETKFLALGHSKFLTEESLVKFVNQCKRGLRLDYVKNFTRLIPTELVEMKSRLDEREVFDNYVVLHYDPENKGAAETKAEVEARKDPILFGLIEGGNRLYYIGDWVDEYCDLTLDKIAESLGAESILEITPGFTP